MSLLLALDPAAAGAGPHRYRIDIPAGPLAAGLDLLARTTGASIGLPGTLPTRRTAELHGSMTAQEALDRLLRDSGLRARAVGNDSFRLEAQAPSTAIETPRRAGLRVRSATEPVTAEIVVTGQKREQALRHVAMSLTVVVPSEDRGTNVAVGSQDVALSVEGLALTNLGPGLNRQFIRGVADSPFNGPSQSTVAVQLDDARITYDAPDPDIRLIDIARVEVLKGPQGPLYGSGAIGGVYHIVSRRPELDETNGYVTLSSDDIAHGGLGGGTEGVFNVPLVAERLALRGVAYAIRSSGWIDTGHGGNGNALTTIGGRGALRLVTANGWTIDAAAALQNMNVADSQYVTASDDTLRRVSSIAEPVDNDFWTLSLTTSAPIGTLKLLSAMSFVDQAVAYTLDASAAAPIFDLAPPLRFHDSQHYKLLSEEIRLTPIESDSWLAGASLFRERSRSAATIAAAGASTPVAALDRTVTEYAAFGEASLPLSRMAALTIGARLFETIAEDSERDPSTGRAQRISKLGISPSLAASWRPSSRLLTYVRYARALRPGGLAPAAGSGADRFDSDQVSTIDLGLRRDAAGRDLSLAASAYATDWRHIQSDYLLPDGLVATRNAGHARIFGIEASAEWRPRPDLRLSAGASLLNARLIATDDGTDVDDRRLPVAPDMTARVGIERDVHLGSWTGTITGRLSYVGRSRLTFDPNLDRSMGKYAVANSSASLTRKNITLGATLDNMLNVKGDSFAFGNPFSIAIARQYTPLRPRTLRLSLSRRW